MLPWENGFYKSYLIIKLAVLNNQCSLCRPSKRRPQGPQSSMFVGILKTTEFLVFWNFVDQQWRVLFFKLFSLENIHIDQIYTVVILLVFD